ncbi:MAG: hypothetical protein JW863_04645, partial [Chitinispirillaceae bacterium]|nr:hypothetical protein [Chitinispirillaceae bacterium]
GYHIGKDVRVYSRFRESGYIHPLKPFVKHAVNMKMKDMSPISAGCPVRMFPTEVSGTDSQSGGMYDPANISTFSHR